MKVLTMSYAFVLVVGVIGSVMQTTFCADIIVDSAAKANLPAVGTAGRLYRVTDDGRGLWMDQGSQWFSLSGEVVNVKEFGAVGDGTTDDTTAIQNAVNSGASTVLFPKGQYKITSQINITAAHIKLLGLGSFRDIIFLLDTGIDGFNYAPQSNSGSDLAVYEAIGAEFSNFTIKSLSGTSGGKGIKVTSVDMGGGVYYTTHKVFIEKVCFSNLGNAGTYFTHPPTLPTTAPSQVSIRGCYFNSCAEGIRIDEGGDLFYIEDTTIKATNGIGIYVDFAPGGATVVVRNVVFATNQKEDILVKNATHFTISECRFEQAAIVKTGTNGAMIDVTPTSPDIIGNVTIENSCFNGESSTYTTSLIRLDRVKFARVSHNFFYGATNGVLVTANAEAPLLSHNQYVGSLSNNVNNSSPQLIQISDDGRNTRIPAWDNTTVSEWWSTTANESTFKMLNGPAAEIILRAVATANNRVIDFQTGTDSKLKITTNGVSLGGGTSILKHISGTVIWNPPSIGGNGGVTSATVTVTGAVIGDTVAVGFSNAVPAGALLVGAVTAADTVTVTLFNKTGSNLDLASGTLRADVWQH